MTRPLGRPRSWRKPSGPGALRRVTTTTTCCCLRTRWLPEASEDAANRDARQAEKDLDSRHKLQAKTRKQYQYGLSNEFSEKHRAIAASDVLDRKLGVKMGWREEEEKKEELFCKAERTSKGVRHYEGPGGV
ncbi:hypothetical protein CLAFUW4_11312 [Fulvia fulva]|uniref:Uncharacterized protein n=1 Tax=Passalora fulva TaxID=5499 RepID=A0A9Q8URK1_PASFU|nr:uncharacterized protein CLAFUR5_10352 [Fulvia fulva]KAK4619863.1 hypothetical protein CLAFUR4_11318 [Fulvia fulva]KAK4620861.1 hypothetical protein CLAFUR0_11323 [Fulvia fulva]UJO19810.1 hypothetical protein CLAFUR5_10352 [Fulvia fulva]WPV16939.1 hypothetical protein CLAFUW4_11312 [Fulvia fulva]WPV32223.1 hypothetical protein CLAFUW7_11308 [Fulvia fulva]